MKHIKFIPNIDGLREIGRILDRDFRGRYFQISINHDGFIELCSNIKNMMNDSFEFPCIIYYDRYYKILSNNSIQDKMCKLTELSENDFTLNLYEGIKNDGSKIRKGASSDSWAKSLLKEYDNVYRVEEVSHNILHELG